MKRTALIVVGVVALVSPTALHAQRAGGGHAGVVMGGPRSNGRGPQTAPPHAPSPNAAPPRTRPTPQPPVPSLDHPLPYNFNAVKPAPLLGRERTPAPFRVPPGYYNRQHPLAAIPYGYYGYGYSEPDYTDASAPRQQEAPPAATAPAASERPQSEPAPVPVPVPVVPHPPQTMYVIPGCYGGNVPPMKEKLPKGCDIAKLRLLRPPQ